MNSAELIARMCAREEFTVIPAARLKALYQIAQSIAGMPGAFVECGVWNGGSAAVLAHAAYMRRRHVWLFDSWEGTPEPGNEDGQQARAKYDSHGGKLCVGDITKPGQAFAVTGITDNILHLRKGWFEETLPRDAPEIGDIAVLHIDSDWYASVKVCLQVLYPQVVEADLSSLTITVTGLVAEQRLTNAWQAYS